MRNPWTSLFAGAALALAAGRQPLALDAADRFGRHAQEVQEPVAPPTPANPEDQLRRATQHYADLVLAMDHAAIAALFTPDGEVAVEGQPPIQGPEAIRKHLESFKDYHVQAETLTADTVAVQGTAGRVTGTYRQRVRLPAGDIVEVSGTYTADWQRDTAGVWRLRRMSTKSGS